MPRGPEVSRHMNLYGEAAPPGCMGGMLNMFDWNSALVGGGKKLLADLDFADGLEAPRNSLDNASGGSGGTSDLTPKSSSATKADIPYGFKLAKSTATGAKELSRANDKKLRSPSVVARLMGLEALPDAPSAAKKAAEQQSLLKIQKDRGPVTQKFFKDLKMRPHSQSTKDQVSVAPEFKAQGGGREAPKRNTEQGKANHKDPGEAAPSRDLHPQEKQLQEFKKEFASKLSSHSHDDSSSHRSRPPAESFNRDVHVKRVVHQEKMAEAEARDAPSSARAERTDPKHLEAALKKLNKSKELQEFLEVLQSNKEFFLKFLQEPNSVSLDKLQQDLTIPEESAFTPPPPIEVKKSKGAGSESKGKSSEKKKKGGISPSAFARRFMESRREGKEQKEKSRSQHGSKSQTETEDNTPISTPRTSTSLLPRLRGRSKSKHVTDTEASITPTNEKEQAFYKVDPYSPGNIVLLRPGSNDSTGISSPVSTLSYSPSLSRSGKEANSKITQKRNEDAARQYQWENGDSTPRSEKSRFGDWDYASPSEPATTTTTRNGRESSSSSSITRHMEKHIDSRYERERSKDPKDIARNIIREARASAIELAKFEHPPTAAETLSRVSSSASAGRRIPSLRSRGGFDSNGGGGGDVTGSSDGEITPVSTGRLSTTSSRGDFLSQSSSLAGGGLGSSSSLPSTVGGTQFSPRAASQDLTSGRPISADRRTQRFDVDLQPQQQRKEEDTQQHGGGPLRKTVPESISNNNVTPTNRPGVSPRSRSSSTSSQVSSKVLRKAIAGSVLENRLLASSDPHQHATGLLSSPQLLEKGEPLRATTNAAASQSEEDSSVASSPKTLANSLSLQRCRSVPNAALVRDTRTRGEQQQHQQQQSQSSASSSKDGGGHHSAAGTSSSSTPAELSHEPSSSSAGDSFMVSGGKQFADSYKRGVEAVGSLFARAKSKERNKIFVRSRKKTPASASKEPQRAGNASAGNTQLPGSSGPVVNTPSSSSSLTPAMMTKEDVIAFSKLDPGNSRRKGAITSSNHSHSELEEEAAEEVKRVSLGGTDIVVVRSNSERERGSNLGRLSVDKRLSESPSMLTPVMQRVRVNSDMAIDKSGSSNSDSITITDVLEASAPQLSRSPKIRSIATDTPRSSKDGETQEIGVDKSGQPSPISVLDSPFEEDSPSPREFNEISSDLQDLRLKLRLLRLDGSERPRLSLDRTHDVNDLGPQLVKREVIHEISRESVDGQISSSAVLSSLDLPASTPADAADVANKRALLESIDIEEIPYPADRKEDLVYVRNLLVASEFVESPSKVVTRWHSPTQPLDPILFENLEEYYSHGAHTPQFVIVDGQIRRSRAADLQPRHRLLFDTVNEVLLRKLGPYLSSRPWVKPDKPMLRPIPVGKVLVSDTWTEVCAFFPSSGVDASTFLLTRDLCTGPEWAGGRESFEEFGLELEETIFNELMNEAVQSLIQTKW